MCKAADGEQSVTITQLIQSSPANANELFAKLAATSNGAAKTRESLFSDLKAELELHSRLEEEHLFPALKKHKETKDLVRAAVEDNKQARALLAELEGMPKDGDEFLAKLAELRKAFQQHVRDEKKELLPAVKTALSNEEAQSIVDKVEAEKAAVEENKRKEAEQRRAAAREEREKAERRRAQAEARKQRAREEEKREQAAVRAEQRRAREEERRRQEEAEAVQRQAREAGAALAHTGEVLLSESESMAAAGGAAAQAGAEAAVRNSQQVAGAMSNALGQAGTLMADAVQSYSDRARPAMETLQVLASLPPVAAGAAAQTGKTWFELVSRTAESRSRRSLDLLHCVTPGQFAEVQSRFLGETMQAWMEANARLLDISLETYRGMVEPAERSTGRAKDARQRA
jgi:hypothetical protein